MNKQTARATLAFALAATLLCIGFAAYANAQEDNGANDTAKAKAASELARNILARQLQIDATTIGVISTEPQTWPDSSLGCGQPGSQAAQVVTHGFEVTLSSPRGNYRVHSAGAYAVVCGAATEWRHAHGTAIQARNLNEKIEEARADLAQKLHAPLNEIRALTSIPTEWPDSAMGCSVAGEKSIKQPTKGFRIALRYDGRIYTYHTDLIKVRACPAIATE